MTAGVADAVLHHEHVAALEEAQLRARDAGGDGLAVLGRRDPVVAPGGHEGGAGDAVEPIPHVVVAARLELEDGALGGLRPSAHEVDEGLVVRDAPPATPRRSGCRGASRGVALRSSGASAASSWSG